MADKKQNLVKFGEVVAKCWEDEAYRKRFLEDPEGVLTEAGFVVDEGVTYKVIEQPKMVKYVVLPDTETKEAVQAITKAFLNKVEQSDAVIPEGAEVRIIQELSMAAGGNDVALVHTETNLETAAVIVGPGPGPIAIAACPETSIDVTTFSSLIAVLI